MSVFIQFYLTMLGFVNYRLFNSLNIAYPPSLELPEDKYNSLRDMNKEEILEEASLLALVHSQIVDVAQTSVISHTIQPMNDVL